MSNGRDDRTKIDFTVADRVMLVTINMKLDGALKIKDQTIKNTTAIKYLKWGMGILGAVMLGLLTA